MIARIVHIVCLCAVGTLLPSPCVAAEAKPNILLLLTDDQSYDAVHALGWDELSTPNLDQLANKGVTFTHAYNQGSWSGAVCVASRTMLFTGKSLWRAHRDEPYLVERYVETGRSWPQRIAAAGYRTCMTGKWHVNADPAVVFEQVKHVRPGMPGEVANMYDRPRQDQQDLFDPSNEKADGYWNGRQHWSEIAADDAIEMLRKSSVDRRPFFLYIGFNAPHDPRQAPAEYVAMYPANRISVPKSFVPRYPFAEAMGAGPELRDERLAPFPRTPFAVRTHRAEYAAIITHLDAQIGRILEELDRLGLRETTRIIFTADNGLAIGRHGLMGKQNMFDHSVRVPLILTGPGLPRGKRIDTRVYMQDIFPTVLSWVGASDGRRDFRDLTPLLDSAPHQKDNDIYGAYLDRQRMITSGEWKLIVYPTISQFCLYNIKDDPEELVNLAEQAKYRGVVQRLFAQLRVLQASLDDPCDLPEPFASLCPTPYQERFCFQP